MHHFTNGGGGSLFLNTDSSKPIYIQIAEGIETMILQGKFKEHDQVYSQYKLAEMLTINPATAAKGLNVLAEEGILYDRRGIGKFVAENATAKIKEKRKDEILSEHIKKIVQEAFYLNIREEELINLIKKAYKELGGLEK